jgi:DUF971 family protein
MTLFIKSISQVDKSSFKITFSDEKKRLFRFSELQRVCPCSSCEKNERIVDQEIGATKIASVGSYALRIDFTSGCSKGIFTYAFLRKLGDEV